MTPLIAFAITTLGWLGVLTVVMRGYLNAYEELKSRVKAMDQQLQQQGAANLLQREREHDLLRRIQHLDHDFDSLTGTLDSYGRMLGNFRPSGTPAAPSPPTRPTSFERIRDDKDE